MKNILLVNPWIYDFAAYDLWLKPWGLLKLSSILKEEGFNVFLVDALDRHHRSIPGKIKDVPDGTGKYISIEVDKPGVLKDIPRRYKRYGLPVELFTSSLPEKNIDLIFISSGMTYWYPGVFSCINILKKTYPGVRIILGGPYATLSSDHAREKSGADIVIKNFELNRLSSVLNRDCDFSFKRILDQKIDLSGYDHPKYGVLRVSLGCPFNCTYCAQKSLSPDFMLKDTGKAIEEYEYLLGLGIKKFAFYDDALLFDQVYLKDYLKKVISLRKKSAFYTPNGLHARFLSAEIALLFRKAGFVMPTLSLETTQEEENEKWHKKVTRNELVHAVEHLKKAGYGRGEYMVYLMLGLPGSVPEKVEQDIEFIHSLGAKISLSEFSPIPGTHMGEMFVDYMKEPLLHNNSVFPTFTISDWTVVKRIKEKAVKLNHQLR